MRLSLPSIIQTKDLSFIQTVPTPTSPFVLSTIPRTQRLVDIRRDIRNRIAHNTSHFHLIRANQRHLAARPRIASRRQPAGVFVHPALNIGRRDVLGRPKSELRHLQVGVGVDLVQLGGDDLRGTLGRLADAVVCRVDVDGGCCAPGEGQESGSEEDCEHHFGFGEFVCII
jgi:hypothetical protein